MPVEESTKDYTEKLWSLSRVVEDLPDSWAEPHLAARAGSTNSNALHILTLLAKSALYFI